MILIRYYSNKDDKDDPLSYYQEKITKLLNENKIKPLKALLEFILNKYKQDPRYQNSPYYLKLWLILIFYIDKHRCKPFILPILFGLIESRIGDKLAILYETIASELIQQNQMHQAKSTLLLGINRNAQPIKRLKSTLLYFEQTHSIQFDMYETLFNNSNKGTSLYSTNEPKGHVLLHWIHVKLHHYIRKDILRECIQHSLSFEEYRSIHRIIKEEVREDKQDEEIQEEYKEEEVKEQEEEIEKDNDNSQVLIQQLPFTPQFIQSVIFSSSPLPNYYCDLLEPTPTIDMNKRVFHSRNRAYRIVKKLGQGGFAIVYLVQDQQSLYALKVQQPPHPWEFFILSQLQPLDFILPVYECHHYTDTSYLFMKHLPYGNFLDFFNRYRHHAKSTTLPEPIVLILTWKLLSQLLILHTDYRISHNDLKLDNIMVHPPACQTSEDLDQIVPKLILIDFGQSIYTPALPQQQNTPCHANWINDPHTDYPLFQTSFLPFHADYWQLAVMVHLLLFGIPLAYQHQNTFRIRQTIKRYWHKQLWTRFFHVMMNAHILTAQDIQDIASELHTASTQLYQENSRILHPIYSIIDTQVLI